MPAGDGLLATAGVLLANVFVECMWGRWVVSCGINRVTSLPHHRTHDKERCKRHLSLTSGLMAKLRR